MKTAGLLIFIFVLASIGKNAYSQTSTKDPKFSTVTIKVSSQCESCKKRIEKALGEVKGVKNSVVDLKLHVVKVVYDGTKTNPNELRVKISKTGYDADDIKADQIAYNNLPPCCKNSCKKEDCKNHKN